MSRGVALFLRLVALRYRLQWAHVRRSIARTVGYVAFQIVVAVIALWALAAGISAFATAAEYDVVRPVVRFVLFAVFVSTIGGSVLLGFGMHQTFSDRALRAYPISALQRFWMRHCIGLMEPLWLVSIAAYGGFALAAWLLDVVPGPLALASAALLLLANYLLAHVLVVSADRLAATPFGSFVLLLSLQLVILAPILISTPEATARWSAIWAAVAPFTPPALTADILTGADGNAPPLVLGLWCLAAIVLLAVLEHRAAAQRSPRLRAVCSTSLVDHAAAAVWGGSAPLVAQAMRFYLRNTRVRVNIVLFLPLLAYVVGRFHHSDASGSLTAFEVAYFLGGCLGLVTLPLAMNVFGFDGAGFRRYLLLPCSGADVVRSFAAATTSIGAAYLGLAWLLWLVAAPTPSTPTMLVMLLSQSMALLLVLHSVGIWASVLIPYRGDYERRWSRDPRRGLALLVVAVLVGLPLIVRGTWLDEAPLVEYWYVPIGALAAALCVYSWTLKRAPTVFDRRRDSILLQVEARA